LREFENSANVLRNFYGAGIFWCGAANFWCRLTSSIVIYIHTSIHSYIHTFIHSCTFIHSYLHTFIHSYIHTFIHSYIHKMLRHILWLGNTWFHLSFQRHICRVLLVEITRTIVTRIQIIGVIRIFGSSQVRLPVQLGA
jgi:hypothetical protein